MASIALSLGNYVGEMRQVLTEGGSMSSAQGNLLVNDDAFLSKLVTNITDRVLEGALETEVFTKEETIDDADILSFID